ncbi:MAG: hypothetical protein JSW16_04080 [Dehalococcoidales bacterium]|nr:MAG: hypothetical protein JSW16_04080 [Dehalococcoidales bacterium]
MPDTEEEDSAAETFWPEGYKQVIRDDVRRLVNAQLDDGNRFKHVYRQRFSERYSDLGQFLSKISDMIVIGAENGADNAFDDIIDAFWTEAPLPPEGRYTRYLWPEALPEGSENNLQQIIIDEYSQDNVYQHAYRVGYTGIYATFDQFIEKVARLVVTGTQNGADDLLGKTYMSFGSGLPLPPARRHPRRLKMW